MSYGNTMPRPIGYALPLKDAELYNLLPSVFPRDHPVYRSLNGYPSFYLLQISIADFSCPMCEQLYASLCHFSGQFTHLSSEMNSPEVWHPTVMFSTSCLTSSILLFDSFLSSSFLVLMNHLK